MSDGNTADELPPLRIGLAGLGTVGGSVAKILVEDADALAARAGRRLELVRVASRTPKPDMNIGGASFDTDLRSLSGNEVDVIVELIGGVDTASDVIRTALAERTPVVTANKALIAEDGNALFELAQTQPIGFEASVAGGIPIINALTNGLTANNVEWLAGIINGTSNYILTAMEEEGKTFADALADAQRLGYAEADPTFDVEGIDAAQKLAILAALAFGTPIDADGVFTEGISSIAIDDIRFARELGYSIKHLGFARRGDGAIEARVHPTLIRQNALLGSINGVTNAVTVCGDLVGSTTYVGPGAGGDATASSVVSDLVALARGALAPPKLGGRSLPRLPIDEVVCPFYLRISAIDEPGVFGHVADLLGNHGVSIEGAIQRPDSARGNEPVPIVILTNAVRDATMAEVGQAIEALPGVAEAITKIRVAEID